MKILRAAAGHGDGHAAGRARLDRVGEGGQLAHLVRVRVRVTVGARVTVTVGVRVRIGAGVRVGVRVRVGSCGGSGAPACTSVARCIAARNSG